MPKRVANGSLTTAPSVAGTVRAIVAASAPASRRNLLRAAKVRKSAAPSVVSEPRKGSESARNVSTAATPGTAAMRPTTRGEKRASYDASESPSGRTKRSARSVSSAQATTVVRNDPIKMATATIMPIATISEATATLVRRGEPPRFAAAKRAAGARLPASAAARREVPAMASGTHNEAPTINEKPAAYPSTGMPSIAGKRLAR